MIKATEHIPPYVDIDDEPYSCEVNSVSELLEVDWVKGYTKWKEFHNFCQSKNGEHLMIESEDGKWWWVVAYIKGKMDLPIVRMNYGVGNV